MSVSYSSHLTLFFLSTVRSYLLKVQNPFKHGFFCVCVVLIVWLLTSGSDSFCIAQKKLLSVALTTKTPHNIGSKTDPTFNFADIFCPCYFKQIFTCQKDFCNSRVVFLLPWSYSTDCIKSIQCLTVLVSEPILAWATCGRLSFQRNVPTTNCTLITQSHL